MTGRGAGFCAGFDAPGFDDRGRDAGGWGRGGGRGGGWGRGGGRGGRGGGWRHRNTFYTTGLPGWQRASMGGAPSTGPIAFAGAELEALQREVRSLEQTLENLRHRIREIESSAESK